MNLSNRELEFIESFQRFILIRQSESDSPKTTIKREFNWFIFNH